MDITSILPEGKSNAFWEQEQSYEQELHVDCNQAGALEERDGSIQKPFQTINEAAAAAVPGTRVWIHGGVYRECVHPAMGGTGPDRMICYEAWQNEPVCIKASIEGKNFTPSRGWRWNHFSSDAQEEGVSIWEIKLNPEDFKGYNPFCAVNILHDRLFLEYDKTDMTTYLNRRGMVFCDGKPLVQVSLYHQLSEQENAYWVEANGQTVHVRLSKDDDPKKHRLEITCREQCFAPEIPFLSYIKVKGITCAHAATGAPVPQRGSISCFRGHHWIIEDCEVDWANGVGIDIGNECWHHSVSEDQIIGNTIIRRCRIKNAGVCGIAGLFAQNLLIEDNVIEGTGWQRMELSWEAGAIKIHNCRNSLIRRNIFTKTFRADHLWLDCNNENNRITQNLFLDGIEQREAVFIECTRDGVNLIDNNIFWNVEGRFDAEKVIQEPGSSGWYKMEEDGVVNGYAIYGEGTDHLYVAHNLIGRCKSAGYFAKPVAFRMHGNLRGGTSRDAHFINNIFYECGEAAIKMPTEKNQAEGNLYVSMNGGYLRILYPAPPSCLDLPAWQEFYGFDQEGQEGAFQVDLDTDYYTLVFRSAAEYPWETMWGRERHHYVIKIEDIKPVTKDLLVSNDFFGAFLRNDTCKPGPFEELVSGRVYHIDPRKL
ncbi:right-handed parallel beta-helix repeat-containing protein [Clostridium sp. E02]|uniref:right-handed parallel beta-helix repeat-containing protein n=1 Tax=Clostridium sp. E02 TaxID=2487134 RepID=UPI000F51E913|nr:right-handed parallel beta-helix repeat-containing protein [Clostridium sp. E02]